ncbi:unnamed protein product [Blepharisma stoltei]|uniref:Pseudouridine synthase RsuA/RluA-like domain-containing protein n=1 Tax=Blepharisma stoltei TaxID=1481888 RepID=A0AAU9J896_9CILI|nr:unnamed protein product [Blepharisma stoltei]
MLRLIASRFSSSLLLVPPIPSTPIQDLPRVKVVLKKEPSVEITEPKEIWLSKKLADSGICSRAQAERFIEAGMISANNKIAWKNIKILDNTPIKFHQRNDYNTNKLPLSEHIKIWTFYKPRDVSSYIDGDKPTVFQFLRNIGFPNIEYYSVGRLDFRSEGLMLLTNDKDTAVALDEAASGLKREYKIRVCGKLRDEILEAIRRGASKGKKFRPMIVWANTKKTKNIWLKAILKRTRSRELRRVFENYRLRVNRLVRLSYGPYRLDGLKPGEYLETHLEKSLHQVMFYHYKAIAEKQ